MHFPFRKGYERRKKHINIVQESFYSSVLDLKLINEMEKVWPFVEFISKNFTFRIVLVVVFFIILKLKNYLSFYYTIIIFE